MIKNVVQSKRQRRFQIVHSLQERWFRNLHLLDYWMVWGGGVVLLEIWIHWQNQFFDCGGDFHNRSFQLSARWNPQVPANIFLSSDTFIALKSVLILFTLRATFFASILAEIKKINFRYGQASRQWKLSTTKCQSPYAESWLVDPMPELLLFVYNKSHVTLQMKSNAERVNSPFWWHFATTERCKLHCGSRCDIWFHQLTSDH